MLHSKIYGEGNAQVLLILHGLFGMGDNWATLAKQWEELNFKVHVLDMPNHGRSPWTESLAYEDMVDDLDAYVEEKNLIKFHLLGHSLGGKTAMTYATMRPEHILSLIVVDIAPKYYPVHHHEIIEALKSLDFNTISSRNEADEQLKIKIKDFGIRQFLLKSLYKTEEGNYGFRYHLDLIAEQIEEVGQALPDIAYSDVNTLFLYGKKSNYINPDEDIHLILKHFPNAKLVGIADAGHWIHAEQPTEVYHQVAQFLGL